MRSAQIILEREMKMEVISETNGYDGVKTTREMPARRSYPPRLQTVFNALRERCVEKLSKEPKISTVIWRPTPLTIQTVFGVNGVVIETTNSVINIDTPYCNRTMDMWGGCWPDTLPGRIAKVQCPDVVPFDRSAFVYRQCTENGTWYVNPITGKTWANYSACLSKAPVSNDTLSIYIFIGGFCLSLLLLSISLGIFIRFKQLRCERITIHKNLFISYIFTGISWILYYVFVALDGDVMLKNPVWCQTLHVICQYFVVCNFLWMFCEGLYLNTIMVYAFTSGKMVILICHLIGWGLPVVLTSLYGLLRGIDKSSTECWLGESALQWIIYGPIVFSLAVNVLFLVNIIRLLVTKLRQMPEADQTRKATRATLILIPLLGLQYLLFPVRPEVGSNLEEVYHIAIAVLVSLQGAFVSLMYCFCNSEVIQVLKRKWRQHRLMHTGTMRSTSTHVTTYTTLDPVTQTPATYCSTATNNDPPIEMLQLDGKV